MKLKAVLKTALTSAVWIGVIISSSQSVYAERINTAEVITRTSEAFLSCADFELAGGCMWWRLKCGWRGCRLRTTVTLKIEHYVPDVTFQAYKNAQSTPWRETGTIMTAVQADYDGSIISTILGTMGSGLDELGGGGGTESRATTHSNMTFTLVDAFGNPTNRVLSSLGSFAGLTCRSRLTSMYPYYISNLDTVAWRFGIPEMFYLESLNPFGSLLGDQTFNYGGYYPRIGHATNHDEFKEGALAVFRSGHFVSRRSQSHIYTSISNQGVSKSQGFYGVRPPETSLTSGKWQQISPAKDDDCHFMPLPISTTNPKDGKRSYRSDDGNYVWNLWRRYRCCQKPSGWRYLTDW